MQAVQEYMEGFLQGKTLARITYKYLARNKQDLARNLQERDILRARFLIVQETCKFLPRKTIILLANFLHIVCKILQDIFPWVVATVLISNIIFIIMFTIILL